MAAMLYFAAVFVNCLLFAPVVKATTRGSLFSDTGLDNVIFTSSVLFESESRSLLDCGRQCSLDKRCVTFTHVTRSSSGSCRGHSDTFTSTSTHAVSVPGAKTFTRLSLLPEGCTNYTVLDDVGRDVNRESETPPKDDGLQPGWYRFLLNGANAVMQTSCISIKLWLMCCRQNLARKLQLQWGVPRLPRMHYRKLGNNCKCMPVTGLSGTAVSFGLEPSLS